MNQADQDIRTDPLLPLLLLWQNYQMELRFTHGDWVVKTDGKFSVSKPNDFASQHEA